MEMTIQITPSLLYLTRRDWGALTSIPRLGWPVAKALRTHGIMHHTVVIDDDATPNLWESMGEVEDKMRQLQTIRPDLGDDVPYNHVGFLMDSRLVVCEGRGEDRTGAHTHGHNTAGMALALEGNFELARDIGPWVPAISRWWGWLKYERGMDNLGSVSPAGAAVFGHQDFRDPNDRDTWTACPGSQVMARIREIAFAQEEEDDMPDEETRKKLAAVVALFQEAAAYAAQGLPAPPGLKAQLLFLLSG
jgi:hypothetical protein